MRRSAWIVLLIVRTPELASPSSHSSGSSFLKYWKASMRNGNKTPRVTSLLPRSNVPASIS